MNNKSILSFLLIFIALHVNGQWVPAGLGMNAQVIAMAPYSGYLYACGNFELADSNPCIGIARWNGTAWSAVGGGLQHGATTYAPQALIVFGGELFVGGYLDSAAGLPVHRVAKWNGTTWSAVGICPVDDVKCFCIHGGALYAGGFNGIAKWDGATWSTISSTLTPITMISHNAVLYVGGNFTDANGGDTLRKLAKWDGTGWSSVGGGVTSNKFTSIVRALASFGGKLYVGGAFTTIGNTTVNHIANWDGAAWADVGGGVGGSTAAVTALVADGTRLIIGGTFWTVNSIIANRAATWDGASWTILGTDNGSGAACMAIYNSELYSGGQLSNGGQNCASKWTGGTFTAVNNFTAKRNVRLYPNPTHGKLYITGCSAECRFIVTNLTGKVYRPSVSGNHGTATEINIEHLDRGVYFLSDENGSMNPEQFIINN